MQRMLRPPPWKRLSRNGAARIYARFLYGVNVPGYELRQ